MLSLYIHIPFCDQKCGYCSFTVLPIEWKSAVEKLIEPYVDAVCEDIRYQAKKLWSQQIKTIYFGGGTPTRIGKENLCKIIDTIDEVFDLDLLAELTIECNPFPAERVLDIIQTVQKRYTTFPRIRRSIGVQTFDGDVLKESSRMYSLPAIKEFLRNLQPIKQVNTSYNFDFIAFGKRNTTKKWEKILRDKSRQQFFQDFVESWLADGFSLYTLELFPGSDRYNQQIAHHSHQKDGLPLKKYGSDDDVYDEFHRLKTVVQNAEYHRYEISNFATTIQSSIHNRVYRNMENYLGIWVGAASFFNAQYQDLSVFDAPDAAAIRFTQNKAIADYCKWSYKTLEKPIHMDQQERNIEKLFLSLRTDRGVENLSSYEHILEKNRKELINAFEKQGYCLYENDKLLLTDSGMDIYNTIITDLLAQL